MTKPARTSLRLLSMAALVFLGLAPTASAADRIARRQERQQQRIGHGVSSGRLTAGETARLETREALLDRRIRRDRRDGGGLQPAERRRIEHRQDRLSRDIYRQKHDRQRRRG